MMRLGVCYYPEQWPEAWWEDDARRMAAMGLTRVRIGEFAWSRIEPSPGRFEWGWLDRAIETLHRHGLGVILGTPTATPPKWLVDSMPDMIAVDAQGRPRRFGSRRHYCFSHAGYRAESRRITTALAERYGRHPAVVAWQTDNEYGCHDTVASHSAAAAQAFRAWLAARYGDIAALNDAWGTVFWSAEYRSFDEIDLPSLTVTEPNPAHSLDFQRFSSDQVLAFNREQVDILRAHSPGRDITHNAMGFVTSFDHHALGRDLDVVTWDSYPLGFLEQFWFSEAEKLRYARQGHPDIAAFHHDLYRGCGRGRFAVMEQQPGPVNWAARNPAPLPGMVRLWTLEAMAHGAEFVAYFRWRQAPFAQEQMHAGLLRPDRVDDIGAHEARAVAADIATLTAALPAAQQDAEQHTTPRPAARASVALVFDYTSVWVTDIQPQGAGFSALRQAFEWYSALRARGLDIDIVPPDAALEGYRLVVVPCLPVLPAGFVDRLAACSAEVLIGPRTGSKTPHFQIPPELPPGHLQRAIPLKVTRVESLRPGVAAAPARDWLEHCETALTPAATLADGQGLLYRAGRLRYLAATLGSDALARLLAAVAGEAGLVTVDLPEGVRLRRHRGLRFAFNYAAEPRRLPADTAREFLLGAEGLPPAGVAAWREVE
jgi:beta-galactosidase